MKKFLIKALIISLPILILLISVNFFGDAAKLFDSKYEIRMAEIITNDNYVKNISNYDERIFQKELILKIKESPEISVIGSSRTMQIRSEYFPEKKILNNSVSGASIEDLVAIYQIYKESNFMPEKFILGIDPWFFNDNNGQTRWKSIESYYEMYHNKYQISDTSFSLEKYKELISFSYFQSSIKNIPDKILGKPELMPTLNKYNKTNTKLTDGSLVYNADYRNASQEKIDSKIRGYISGNIYSLINFNKISEKKWNEFQNLIYNLEKNNIDIELFLCPYAPIVYETISKKYPNVARTEKLINDFARLNQIKIHGSFNPFILGYDKTYFYDGMHCKEKGIKEILKN